MPVERAGNAAHPATRADLRAVHVRRLRATSPAGCFPALASRIAALGEFDVEGDQLTERGSVSLPAGATPPASR
jgi:hypothetical protein